MTTRASRLTICGLVTATLGIAVIILACYMRAAMEIFAPAPKVFISTMDLGSGVKVEVKETAYHSFTDASFGYTFQHNGRLIMTDFHPDFPIQINQGASGGTRYFSTASQICIYSGSRWTTWSTADRDFQSWQQNMEAACFRQLTSHADTLFEYEIDSFEAKGNTWTVTLGDTIRRKELIGFVPVHVSVRSTDAGATWHVVDPPAP